MPLLPFASAPGKTVLVIGTTTISGGTSGRVLYDNAGVVGEMTTTGSGTVLVLATSPTLVTPVIGAATGTSLVITQSIAATSTDGFVATNTTAAAAGAQQWSPRIRLTGQGWKTTSTAASQAVDWIVENQPVQGAASPATNLVFSTQVNAGGYSAILTTSNTGVVTIGGSSASLVCNSGTSSATWDLLSSNRWHTSNNLASQGTIQAVSFKLDYASGDITLVRGGTGNLEIAASTATVQFGTDVNGAAPNQQLQACNGITGTDKSGANFTLTPGIGTGAGTPGSFIVRTGTALTTGTTAQTRTTRLTITTDATWADGLNFVLGTTTGTQIGAAANQKLALWGTTPIVQPTTGIAAAAFVTNTSLIANDTATWGGYTVGQVVQALRNMGVLA